MPYVVRPGQVVQIKGLYREVDPNEESRYLEVQHENGDIVPAGFPDGLYQYIRQE